MKSVAITCGVMMLCAASASGNELAVSKSTLGNMGLGSMQTMSDSDGLAVRGKGTFASVSGGSLAVHQPVTTTPWGSFASGPATTAANNYEAGAQWLGKDSAAAGQSLSFAGQIEVLYAQDPTGFALGVHAVGGISGGGASASAF